MTFPEQFFKACWHLILSNQLELLDWTLAQGNYSNFLALARSHGKRRFLGATIARFPAPLDSSNAPRDFVDRTKNSVLHYRGQTQDPTYSEVANY
jgi:hypothetical protein